MPRVEHVPGHPLPPPESYWKMDGKYYCITPNGMYGNLGGHSVEEHDDGTISVSPSILVTSGGAGKSWHGFLTKGVWKEC